MNTRIKRYAKLRQQIDQEINMIKLKNENNQRVLFYKQKIDKIDPNAFEKIDQEIKEQIPNTNFLFQVKKTSEKEDLNRQTQDIDKWLEVINDIWKEEDAYPKTLDEYSPRLVTENFIQNKLKAWKEQKKQNQEFFTRIINFKQKFKTKEFEKQNQKPQDVQLLPITNAINNKIQTYDQKLEFLIKSKKQKTKWIFWANFFIFIVLFTCMILILTS